MRADGLASCAPLAPREGGTPPRPRKLLEGRPPLLSCAPGTFDEENYPKNHRKPPTPNNSSTSSSGIFAVQSSKHDEFHEERKIYFEGIEKLARPSLYSTFVEPNEKLQSKKETADQSNKIRLLSSLNNQLYPKRQLLFPEQNQKACINSEVPEEQENSIKFRPTAYEIIKEEDETQTSSKVKRNPRSAEVFVHRQSLQTAREESGFNSEHFILPDNSNHSFSKIDHIDTRNNKDSSSSVTPDKSSYKSFNSDSDISDRKEETVNVFRDDISKTTREVSLQNETSKVQSESSSYAFNDGCPAIEAFRESSPTPSTSVSPPSVSSSDQDTPSNGRFNQSKISPLRTNKISCRSRRNRHKSVSDHRYVSLYYSAANKNREICETEAEIELHNVKDESPSFKYYSPELQRDAIQGNSLDNIDIGRNYGNASISSRTNNNDTATFNQNSDARLSYPHTIYRSYNFNRSPSYTPNNCGVVKPNQKVERNLNVYSSIDVCDANTTPPKVCGQIKEIDESKCSAINSTDVSSVSATSAEISENGFSGVRDSRSSVTGGPLENFSALCSSYSRQIPKSRSCFEYASGAGREPRPSERPRPLSLAARRGAVRHRNAEEALSCLLWQPYECREGSGAAGGPGESGAAAGAHSLLATRYGESCAVAMRLTVPAPAHCRAVQPAQLLAHSHAHVPQSELKQVGSDPTVQITNCVASVCDERVSVSDNTVSVNGEVIGSRAVTSSCGVSQTAIQHTPRPPELARVQVVQETPCRSWASCGAQTEEPQGPPPPLAPPPYSTLPHAHPALPLPLPLPGQPHAYPFQPVSLRRCQYGEDSEPPKTCCGAVGARALGLKWFIVLVALAGICCVLVGTVLGAVRAQGRAHLTVLLLMIGVGLVLVTVSGVAWRAVGRRRARAGAARSGTPAGGPGGAVRRGAAACARAHHPYAAMLYPEFHCRPPPPSYQASMHEYRLRLLLLDRAASPPPVACPPPAYRPRPRGMAGGGPPYMGRGARGRRRPEPRTQAPTLSAVVIQNIALEPYDDIKYDDGPEMEPPIGSDTKEEEVQQENKEGNLVTIVQTGPDTSPVIVTVSGSMPEERTNQTHASEIDILAHL